MKRVEKGLVWRDLMNDRFVLAPSDGELCFYTPDYVAVLLCPEQVDEVMTALQTWRETGVLWREEIKTDG